MIFVDTGAFLGWYLPSDQYHRKASQFWKTLQETQEPCYTSNFVVDEVLTLLGRRADYGFAANRAQVLYSSKALVILRPQAQDEKNALQWFQKLSDQQVSFTDCISFALMKKQKLTRVFTFDEHFQRAGFQVVP